MGIAALLTAVALPFAANAEVTIPSAKKTVVPHLSPELRSQKAEVEVLLEINQFGYVTSAEIAGSTNQSFNQATLDAVYQWRFQPATENGKAVASKANQPFYFNGDSIVLTAKKTPQDSNPQSKRKVAPALTPELNNITGEVVLEANLDANGAVTKVVVKSSTHSELEAAAAEALEQWTFKPAIREGKATASRVNVPFSFRGLDAGSVVAKADTHKKVDKAPVPIRRSIPELAASIRDERGEATLLMTVDEYGYVAAVQVQESSHEELSAAATEAAFQWKFKPAIKDGVAVASSVLQPFSFNGGLITDDLPADSMPVVKKSSTPKLPEELSGIQGFVNVRLNLDAQGRVVNAATTKSSHDELEQPTIEAAKTWTFKPAIRDGQAVPSAVVVPFVFSERG